tara:strand:- start:12604 stop:14334 length:1731 start_codon:yes stop_codon:yes gene_type:complete
VRRFLNLFDKKLKYQAMSLLVLMVIASFLELIGIGLVILVLNSFLGITETHTTFINTFFNFFSIQENSQNINNILIFITIIFTIKLLILIFVSYKENSFYAIFREKISNKMYNNFLRRDVISLFKKNSASYLRNFTEELNFCILFFSSLLKIILDSIILTALLVFLFFFNFTITFYVFFIFSIIGILYFLYIKNKLSGWAQIGLKNRKKRIQFINESFLAIKSIKILSRENFFYKKLKLQNKIFSDLFFKVNFVKSLPASFFEYILFISIIILFFFLLDQNYSNERIIQILSVYALVSFRIVPLINKVLGNSQHLRYSFPSVKKLVVEINQKIIEKKKLTDKIIFEKSIKLNFKKFSFEQGKKPFLKNIFLNIRKNQKIGIIGSSGAGKSTIIDILCGFRNFKNGSLKVDNKNVYKNIEGWQSIIGYIPQNIIIFNDTLKKNILFGSEDQNISDKKISKIIDLVDLTYLVKKSSQGLSQVINQDGLNISGGEKQRIGIARALINNPEIIILDEATSGLDLFTEKNVLNTIKKLNKTTIIVSHRHSTLSFCSKIYQIKQNTLKQIKQSNIKKIFFEQ